MARAVTGTLEPGVVSSVTVQGVQDYGIEIINLTGSGVIWYRLDGEDPEVGVGGSHPVLGSRKVNDPNYSVPSNRDAVTVKLISDEALMFTVEGEPIWAFVEGGDA